MNTKENIFCSGRRISWQHPRLNDAVGQACLDAVRQGCVALLYWIPVGNFNGVMLKKNSGIVQMNESANGFLTLVETVHINTYNLITLLSKYE